ncbi:kelch-like protein 20 [Anneissia japonica]|uniref:kelch-like protein 20 n=1 Tax=Anneissia japonica TaxID=1529436 RepID=UPI0014254FEB|nr:kelch-like protein 20 [Anneissia japonica]
MDTRTPTFVMFDSSAHQMKWGQHIMDSLQSLREEALFCDIKIKVEEREFPAHKIVLSAASEYFRAMFTGGLKESSQDMIEFQEETDVCAESFELILNFAYSSHLALTPENVFDVLAAANHLSMPIAVTQCIDYIEHCFLHEKFNFEDFLKISEMANNFDLKSLRETADRYITRNFVEVCETEDFLEYMTARRLASFLQKEDLAVSGEYPILKAVINWIRHDKETRLHHSAMLLKKVRLGLLTAQEIVEAFDRDILTVPQCKLLYDQLMQHHATAKAVTGPLFAQLPQLFAPRLSSKSMVAIGGHTSMSFVRQYNANTKAWEPLKNFAQLPYQTVINHTAVVVGEHLFIAGGEYINSGKNATRNYFFVYNAKGNKWSSLPPMKVERKSFSLVHHEGFIYAIGGLDKDDNPLRSVERYDLARSKWVCVAALDEARYNTTAILFHNKIHIFKGHGQVRYTCFDPELNSWLPEKRLGLNSNRQVDLYIKDEKLYSVCYKSVPSRVYGSQQWDLCPSVVEHLLDESGTVHSGMYISQDQSLIPENGIGAFRIGDRVYFFVNGFCFDSHLSTSATQVYDIELEDWETLCHGISGAAISLLPLRLGLLTH